MRRPILGLLGLLAFLPSSQFERVDLENQMAFVPRISVTYQKTDSKEAGDTGSGSGVVTKVEKLKNGKYKITILTAKHNVTAKKEIYGIVAEFFAKKQDSKWVLDKAPTFSVVMSIVSTHRTLDYAILTGETDKYVMPSKLASRKPRYAEKIMVVGCPLGFAPMITTGVVSRESALVPKTWQMSGLVFFGNSGGPVYSEETGEVIGIVTSLIRIPNGFSTLPITHLSLFLPTSVMK